MLMAGGLSTAQAQLYTNPTGLAPSGDSLAINNRFGFQAALVEDTLVVSAPNRINGEGRLLLYEHRNGSWTFQDSLGQDANGIEHGDLMGRGLAFSEDGRILVGGASGSPKSVIFIRFTSTSTWSGGNVFYPSDTNTIFTGSGLYGFSAALDQRQYAVGAPAAGDAGAVDIFSVSTTAPPVSRQLLTPDNSAEDAGFGASMAMDGGVLAVGAFNDSIVNDNDGRVYIYDLDTTDSLWNKRTDIRLTNYDSAGYFFGSSLALNEAGDELFVGASGQNAVYRYSLNGGGATLQQTLRVDSLADTAAFGGNIAYHEGRLLVGAPGYARSSGADEVGLTYLFQQDMNGELAFEQMLMPNEGLAPGNSYGGGLAVNQKWAVASSSTYSNQDTLAGKTWVFVNSTLDRPGASHGAPATNQPEVSVYPNPAAEQVRLKGFTGEADVRLLNAQGQMVQQARRAAGEPLELRTNLPAGTYLLQVQGADWQSTHRLMLQSQ
jgi:hypothetical protein